MGLTFALYAIAAPAVEEAKPYGMFPFLEAAYPIPEPDYSLYHTCYCVWFAREVSGKEIYGHAWTLRPDKELTIENIKVGDWILWRNHTAVITKLYAESGKPYATLIEANFERCKVTEREIDLTDKTIKGFL